METVGTRGGIPDLGRGSGPSSILVVRLKALGDIVLSLPIVYALRSRFPRSRIRYLCRPRYAEALGGVGELDGVIALPDGALGHLRLGLGLRRERIDCVIDLLGSPRSAMLTLLTGAPMRIGMDTRRNNWCYTHVLPRAIYRDGKRVKCYTLDSNEELVRMLGLGDHLRRGRGDGTGASGTAGRGKGPYAIGFPAAASEVGWARAYATRIGAGGKRLVGLVPGALYQAKSWREEYFIELARRLHDTLDAVPVVLWGPGERELAERIAAAAPGAVVAPPTGVARLGALIATFELLVGIDSGPKHLAVVQGIPTVTLFGPTDPRIWDPMTEEHRALHLGTECFPCRKKECAPNRCLDDITPDMVMEEVSRVLPPPERAGGGARGG